MTWDDPLREVGFFDSAAAVTAARSAEAHDWEPAAIGYLERGAIFATSPSWVGDLLDDTAGKVCQYALRTDGTWIWPNQLAYYVRAYHVELPGEFLDDMASRDWKPPELDDDAVDEVVERYQAERGLGDPPPVVIG